MRCSWTQKSQNLNNMTILYTYKGGLSNIQRVTTGFRFHYNFLLLCMNAVFVNMQLLEITHIFFFSHAGLLRVVMVSSCATHFDFLPSLRVILYSFMSSLTLYVNLFWGLSFSFPAPACLSSSSFIKRLLYHLSRFCKRKVVIMC